MTATAQKPPFNVAQVFLAHATFQHRGDSLARPKGTPHHPQRINVGMGAQDANEAKATIVTIAIDTDPNDGDDKALYDFSIRMVGIVDNVDRTAFTDQQLLEIVATIMFPFVREAVANLTGRGRFGPVWLNPFNVHDAVHSGGTSAADAAEKTTPNGD